MHIKSYFFVDRIVQEPESALLCFLWKGNSDEKESIQSAAGASSANGIAQLEFVDLIKNSGFIPVERDSIYNEIKTW